MCSDCIRLDRVIDRKKAKSDAGINFGFAFVTTLVSIAFLVMVLNSGGDEFAFLILIPLAIALINWYFFYVNLKKSRLPS